MKTASFSQKPFGFHAPLHRSSRGGEKERNWKGFHRFIKNRLIKFEIFKKVKKLK
jgi:hypothetical protein